MFNISFDKRLGFLIALVCLTPTLDRAMAMDVREKLITKAYNCSDFATDATITRPLLSFELPVNLAPTHYGQGFNGGFPGVLPIVGGGGGGQGGGLFRVPSKQGFGGGGAGGPGGNSPPPQQPPTPKDKTDQSKITYQTKDVTEITNLIYETVDPKGWSVHHAKPKIRKLGSILVITQTQRNHDKIKELLDMLREARKK